MLFLINKYIYFIIIIIINIIIKINDKWLVMV